MRKIAIAFFLGSFALACFGRICTAADAVDAAKDKDVRKLLELTGAGKMGMQVFQQMTKSFRTQLPNVPDGFWDEFAKEVKADELVEMVVPIYMKHFSDDEIKELIKFYESPIGRKFIAEQPGIMTESMTAGQQWGQKLGAKVIERLREKGYLPKA